MFVRLLAMNFLIFQLFDTPYLMALAPGSQLFKIEGHSLGRGNDEEADDFFSDSEGDGSANNLLLASSQGVVLEDCQLQGSPIGEDEFAVKVPDQRELQLSVAKAFQGLLARGKTIEQSFGKVTSQKLLLGQRNSLNEIYNPETGELVDKFDMESHDFMWAFYPNVSQRSRDSNDPTYLSHGMKVGGNPYSIMTYPKETREKLFDDIVQLRKDQAFRTKLKQNDDVYLCHIGLVYNEETQSLSVINENDFKRYIRNYNHNRLRLLHRCESLLLFGEIKRAVAMMDLLYNEKVIEVEGDYWTVTFINNWEAHKVLKEKEEALGSQNSRPSSLTRGEPALQQTPKVDQEKEQRFVGYNLPTVYQDPLLKVYEHKDVREANVVVDKGGVRHVLILEGKLGEVAKMGLEFSKGDIGRITQYIAFKLGQRDLEKKQLVRFTQKLKRLLSLGEKSTEVKPFNVKPLFGNYQYLGIQLSSDPHYVDLQKIYADLLPYYTWGIDESQAFLNDNTREKHSWFRIVLAAMTKRPFEKYHHTDIQNTWHLNANKLENMVDIGQGLLTLWKKVEPEFENQRKTRRTFANFVQKNLYSIVLEAPLLKGEDLRDAIVFQLYDRWTRLKAIDVIPGEDYWKKFKDHLLVMSEQRDSSEILMFDYFSDVRFQKSLYQWTELLPQIYGDMKRVPASIRAMLNRLCSYHFSEDVNRDQPPKIEGFLSWLYTTVRDETPNTARKVLEAVDFVSKNFPRVSSSIKPGSLGYVEYVQRMQGRMIVMANNITLLKTLSNSNKYQLNVSCSLFAHLIDLYVVLASNFDAIEKINLEQSFWNIFKNVDNPQDLIDVFEVLHQEMSTGTGWDKNLRQNLNDALKSTLQFERVYEKILEVPKGYRPKCFAIMERNKAVDIRKGLGALKQLFDRWSHTNKVTVDFERIYSELQPIEKWAEKITILAKESGVSDHLSVVLDQIVTNLKLAGDEAKAKASLQEQLAKQDIAQEPFDKNEMVKTLLNLSDTASTDRRMEAFEQMMDSDKDVAETVGGYLNNVNEVLQVRAYA